MSGHANSREATLSADASAHLRYVFSSKVPVSVAGAQAACCRASRRQGRVMQVLVAAKSYMCLRQGTVVQMLR